MGKDHRLYLGHMLDAARAALRLSEGKTRPEYDADEALRYALTHLVQRVGEAARLVPEEVRQRHQSIPWRQIIGMRHRIVHEYLNVD